MSTPLNGDNTPSSIALGAWELGPAMCEAGELREFFCGYALAIGFASIGFAVVGAMIAVAVILI